MADPKNKYKEMLASGTTGRIKMPKGSVAGDIVGAPRKRRLMMKETRVKDTPKYNRYGYKLPSASWRKPSSEKNPSPKYHRYGFRSIDEDDGRLKPVAGLHHTFIYDQQGKPKPSGKGPSKKGDKPLYGYKGTDNPVAKKKKPKKKIPKTKKRIKGTLRDNLPIFGGPGRVPEG